MSSIMMLSGPIGAGKTTVARELTALLPAPVTCIEGDTFWSFIAKPKDSDPRESFRVIMRAMTAAALPFARSGYSVLIDFSIPPEFLKTARVIVKDLPLDYVVLRPPLAVCEARAAARLEGKIANYGPYRDFYALFDGDDRHVLAEPEGDASVLAQRILVGIRANDFRVTE